MVSRGVVTLNIADCRAGHRTPLRDTDTDYVWPVKHNQPALHQDVSATFADTERRTCTAPGGPGLRSLIRVRTIQQNFRTDVSIGLLSDRIGRQPWPPDLLNAVLRDLVPWWKDSMPAAIET